MAGKNGSALLSADELLSGKFCRTMEIEFSAGKKMRLRGLSGEQLAAYIRDEQETEQLPDGLEKTEANLRRVAALVCSLAVNDEGERLFSDDQVDGVMGSQTFSPTVLHEIANRVFALSKSAGER